MIKNIKNRKYKYINIFLKALKLKFKSNWLNKSK